VVSRCGFTLLDARAAKLFERYGLTLCDTLVPEEALKDRVARALAPEAVTRSFAETSAAVGASLEQLRATLEGFDHTLAEASAKSRAKISYQLEKTQRKIQRETLRRDARASGDARRLSDLLYPHRHLQERFYSILPFLAQHGLDAVERIHDALRPDCRDHRVLTL
jgi:uncharacterized protein YllA (UPF0747 family)